MIFHKLKPRGYYDLTQYRATSPMFSDYTSPKMYEADEVKYLVPMTAKEVLEDTENQHFKDALELKKSWTESGPRFICIMTSFHIPVCLDAVRVLSLNGYQKTQTAYHTCVT